MRPRAAPSRILLATLLVGFALPAVPQEREIQRAIIQRDQQSAEFARGVDRQPLENLHAQQQRDAGRPAILSPDPEAARQLLPYERQRMMQEREALAPPAQAPKARPPEPPLPLPGGPRQGVEPITAPGVGG